MNEAPILTEPAQPAGTDLQLFLISFLILFFELICIRLIPAYIRYLGYFTNFILLGCFLGMGLGCMCANRRANLLIWFPAGACLLMAAIYFFRFEVVLANREVIFYGLNDPSRQPVEPFYLLPLVFGLVTGVFILLSQPLGQLLTGRPPLRAYSLNILGSLAGTATFALLSYLSWTPLAWMGLFGALLLWFMAGWCSRPALVAAVCCLGLSLVVVSVLIRGQIWSPYYKITVRAGYGPGSTAGKPIAYLVEVNNIGHQEIQDVRRALPDFYDTPYRLPGKRYDDVLIAGSGTGNDVALSLTHGVKSVDAVEIDPRILDLGRELHPNHPYADPRVTAHLGDARSFLQHTDRQYDLIIFALTDSLTLTSSFAALRLESFLYTVDALRAARAHLKPGGVFVMYNYYRQHWLIEKLAGMIVAAFDQRPQVQASDQSLAVLMVQPGVQLPNQVAGPGYQEALATDDWPFLYLHWRSFPIIYVKAFALVAAITLALLLLIVPQAARQGFSPHFFFMGAAFFLLETKSIVQFALLFGSTWNVNVLVICAILVMVLLANLTVEKAPLPHPGWLYGLLAAALAAHYLVPLPALDFADPGLRFLAAGAFVFLPVFVANIIFSRSLRGSQATNLDLASNLMGALAGGACEYLAMLFGYRALTLCVALFYGLAFLTLPRRELGSGRDTRRY